ncbi:MAG: hypothetical protein U0L26_04865 [Cellulosilyticum sp.]|nr:hypothetical protein [Cellulosilyticum sp.]
MKSRYIKFDFHDNDFGLSAIDAIQTLFINHLFEVTPEWKDDCVNKDELNFSARWEKFNDLLGRYYGGDVSLLAKRLSTLLVMSNYMFHNLIFDDFCSKGNIVSNETIVEDIRNYLIPEIKIKVDISFVNTIDTIDTRDGSTLYLDMTTGVIYRC